MRYIPHTPGDVEKMLAAIGVSSIGDLFSEIPQAVRLQAPLQLGDPLSESALMREMNRLASSNANLNEYVSFMGAGAYDHFVPAALRSLIGRQEFVTAYTPYQAEVSQGVLQSIFEYQTMICQLTGMDVSNASMYDGATAMAEAANMCASESRRNTVLVSELVHPAYRQVLATYAEARSLTVKTVPASGGLTDYEAAASLMGPDVACLIVQSPNFYGIIENLKDCSDLAHVHKGFAVAVTDPVSLGILESPGKLGIDVVVGEGQALGNPPSFGGPFLGFMACRESLIRRIPGRVVGMTRDQQGRRGFVLTLQTREQHIRREKATSNICSNQALNALAACIYLALLGPRGLREMATQCLNRAHYAADRIAAIPGFRLPFRHQPYFKEFLVETPIPATQVVTGLMDRRIMAGVPIGCLIPGSDDRLLVAVTEVRTREEIDALVAGLEGLK